MTPTVGRSLPVPQVNYIQTYFECAVKQHSPRFSFLNEKDNFLRWKHHQFAFTAFIALLRKAWGRPSFGCNAIFSTATLCVCAVDVDRDLHNPL